MTLPFPQMITFSLTAKNPLDAKKPLPIPLPEEYSHEKRFIELLLHSDRMRIILHQCFGTIIPPLLITLLPDGSDLLFEKEGREETQERRRIFSLLSSHPKIEGAEKWKNAPSSYRQLTARKLLRFDILKKLDEKVRALFFKNYASSKEAKEFRSVEVVTRNHEASFRALQEYAKLIGASSPLIREETKKGCLDRLFSKVQALAYLFFYTLRSIFAHLFHL